MSALADRSPASESQLATPTSMEVLEAGGCVAEQKKEWSWAGVKVEGDLQMTPLLFQIMKISREKTLK